MVHPRTLRADYAKPTSVVYVVGSVLNVNLNRYAQVLPLVVYTDTNIKYTVVIFTDIRSQR